ncbi:uncharacterized protein UBRO2_00728 [Ustilago bromivora]|uniref:Uncharacterized protein n=1 Tax=Ustilago bromivora TaxID=307758 RepID=A0A8H8QJR0_9BASI|nr:uncharacterized protein UBRO2_00728 [Ustilago bromivora]
MCTPSRRCSSSPPLSGTSPLPACMDHDPGSSITASLVLALEAWFSCLKQQLDSQLAPPAAVLALPSAGQTSGTSDLYPNQAFASQLRGALQHGVKLGYDTCLDVVNLPMDSDDVHHLHHEMEARLAEGHLCHVTDPISMCLVCSLVSVVPKPHSNKRRTIYHLSHPHKPGTHLLSINDGINTSFVTIRYESLDAIMDFIYARLMGIHFDAFTLQAVSPLLTSHSDMSHYVNNFFGASDTTASPATPIQVLSLSAAALGFKLSHKKAVWDTTKLEILGVELDSVTQTASITQQ